MGPDRIGSRCATFVKFEEAGAKKKNGCFKYSRFSPHILLMLHTVLYVNTGRLLGNLRWMKVILAVPFLQALYC